MLQSVLIGYKSYPISSRRSFTLPRANMPLHEALLT
jgi:hypothetical protein